MKNGTPEPTELTEGAKKIMKVNISSVFEFRLLLDGYHSAFIKKCCQLHVGMFVIFLSKHFAVIHDRVGTPKHKF